MHAPLRRIIAAFGADRCVWGSNFPNALWSKGDTYAQVRAKECMGQPPNLHLLGQPDTFLAART
jgi:predicted TIM-barrel fold metal-dependent hydrolase